jgi:hypothetical protein
MASRKFKIAPDNPYLPCPKCGNKEEFYAHSQQVCEDGCEIWVSCRKCGYDPFHDYENIEGCTGYCVEDVWGSIEPATISMALDSWDELIQKLKGAGEC